MKHLSVLLLLLMITPCLMAQKKEIDQARSYVKSSSNLEQAEKLMKGLLEKDTANKNNKDIYLIWYQAVKKQYDAGNEKLYLKQQYDTAKMYHQTKRMFDILMALDNIDAMPNAKGKVKPKYRKKHSKELDIYRANLYYGGAFFIKKGNYKDAYDMYDCYLEAAHHPLFQEKNYTTTDTLLENAAYWATYSACADNKPEQTLKWAIKAVNNSHHRLYVLQYMAEAYKTMNDDEKYLETLIKGFGESPKFSYFFPRLMDYYNALEKYDTALSITEKALEEDANDQLFLYAKMMALYNLRKYDICVEVCDKLTSLNDTIASAHYIAAMTFLNRTAEINHNIDNKQILRTYYEKARPYMERYRKLMPNDSKKWAMPLYRIYLYLNMGKQFEEIDKVLNDK